MTGNPLDLTALIDLPSPAFLSQCYFAILGRAPDAAGLSHYASRLQKGLPRELVLAEMRHSPEGQMQAARGESTVLDQLHARYLAVRSLPLRNLRWKFLPRMSRHVHGDASFDWGRWINAFILGQQEQDLAQQRQEECQTGQAAARQETAQGEELRHQLQEVAKALQVAAEALQGKGAPDFFVRPLREASTSLQAPSPDVGSVPWEARQALYWLSQGVRG